MVKVVLVCPGVSPATDEHLLADGQVFSTSVSCRGGDTIVLKDGP